jgi:hypothetical protein
MALQNLPSVRIFIDGCCHILFLTGCRFTDVAVSMGYPLIPDTSDPGAPANGLATFDQRQEPARVNV